jgi:hypothetical protein
MVGLKNKMINHAVEKQRAVFQLKHNYFQWRNENGKNDEIDIIKSCQQA